MAPTFRMSVIEGLISAILNAALSGAPPLILSAAPARAWHDSEVYGNHSKPTNAGMPETDSRDHTSTSCDWTQRRSGSSSMRVTDPGY